jgi:hypothetical protein
MGQSVNTHRLIPILMANPAHALDGGLRLGFISEVIDPTPTDVRR